MALADSNAFLTGSAVVFLVVFDRRSSDGLRRTPTRSTFPLSRLGDEQHDLKSRFGTQQNERQPLTQTNQRITMLRCFLCAIVTTTVMFSTSSTVDADLDGVMPTA